MGFGASSTEGYIKWCNRTNMNLRDAGVGERLNKSKQNNLRKNQRVQRMMDSKIAQTFRTLSYKASCVLAGVRPIRLAIEEKVRTYKTTHNNIEYYAPLEVRYWPHPAEYLLLGHLKRNHIM